MTGKVIVGSFRQEVLDEFRAECPEVATSASPSEVSQFLAMYKTGLSESYTPPMQALQVPENVGYLKCRVKRFCRNRAQTEFESSRLDDQQHGRYAKTFRNGRGRHYDRLSRPLAQTARPHDNSQKKKLNFSSLCDKRKYCR